MRFPIGWLVLAALALLVACTARNESSPAPTATPAITKVPAATPTLAPDERRRWGYDPWVPTGDEDPPTLERPLPAGYVVEKVVSGLDRPTHMAVTPDGRLLVAEQPGNVRVVRDGRLLDDPFASVDVYLPDLEGTVELGLVGLAVDPEFDQNGYVYLYYAADHPRRTVIARVRDVGGRGTALEEIFSWEAAPNCCHIGGGMNFAPDGMLLVGMGDHERPIQSQSPLTPPGTILRINRDGSWPDDNPFIGPVYAYGLRNPYDIAIDPETGRIFAGENGFFGQDAVLEIKAGANYGWPGFSLAVPEKEIEGPLIFYHNSLGMAGMEFYASDVLGELNGQLFVCHFNSGAVHAIELAPDGSVKQEAVVADNCYSDIITGPEGFLYFLDYAEGVLYRIALAE